MNNAQINRAFLAATDTKTTGEILESIAKHYGISTQDAFEEIVSDEAEHLLDYLVEPKRSAVSVLMRRHRLAA